MKRLIIFDLDGTLAESKSPLDSEMAARLESLLAVTRVAIISGGNWPQFQNQVISRLSADWLTSLSLLPTCGTKFFTYELEWKLLYSEDFTAVEKTKIIESLKQSMELIRHKPTQTWGDIIEDRGSQITFSALGQQAPIEAKKSWDPDFSKRKQMQAQLAILIPEFSVRSGGTTSIDVTKLGIDKAYGIRKLRDILGIGVEEMIFVGDALFPGGNDFPAKETGVQTIQVRDPTDTKLVIDVIIACMSNVTVPKQIIK